MKIKEITKKDFSEWVKMGLLFWPKHTEEKVRKEFKRILNSKKEKSFIDADNNRSFLGFINISIRNDYVEGSATSPVGYIEGIYVKKEYREKGIAKLLLKEAEKWFVKKGLSEVGSDAEVNNIISQKFHKNVGFKKGEAIVHYIKRI